MLSASFAAVADADARLLVLGSLPGPVSLEQGQYYAHPRNAFWRIMGALVGASPDLPYPARLERLRGSGVALWDVCGAAFRAGALDSAIRPDSVVPNDFAGFLAAHTGIALIAHNGATSAGIYERRVLPALPSAQRAIARLTLPSTSPALARLNVARKLDAWRAALRQAGVAMREPPAAG